MLMLKKFFLLDKRKCSLFFVLLGMFIGLTCLVIWTKVMGAMLPDWAFAMMMGVSVIQVGNLVSAVISYEKEEGLQEILRRRFCLQCLLVFYTCFLDYRGVGAPIILENAKLKCIL